METITLSQLELVEDSVSPQLLLQTAGLVGLAFGLFSLSQLKNALVNPQIVQGQSLSESTAQRQHAANFPWVLDFKFPQVSSFQQSGTSNPPIQATAKQYLRTTRLQISLSDRPLQTLFEGNSASLVAKAVGAAEGTRTPDGGKTWAYQGHRDPGNGVWNLGTFSYQHGATSPEEADAKQLRRLQRQAEILRQQAAAAGLSLTLEEELNGIDLANQSPSAALDRGYINRLKEAKNYGLTGTQAIIYARSRAYIDPTTGRLKAPGLGNQMSLVERDQTRRYQAIEQAIALHVFPSQPTPSSLSPATPSPNIPLPPSSNTAPHEIDRPTGSFPSSSMQVSPQQTESTPVAPTPATPQAQAETLNIGLEDAHPKTGPLVAQTELSQPTIDRQNQDHSHRSPSVTVAQPVTTAAASSPTTTVQEETALRIMHTDWSQVDESNLR